MERDRLLERHDELAVVAEAIASASQGRGRLVLVLGESGIGKTALLTSAGEDASAAGVAVLEARGSELESRFPYGLARQLFERLLRTAPSAHLARLTAGAAAVAHAAVMGDPAALPAPSGSPSFAIVHGLYWLVLNTAAESPVVLAIDDAQWTDTGSAQFLSYLARRVDDVPVAILLAAQDPEREEAQQLVQSLRRERSAYVIRPRPLSVDAIRELAARRLQGPPPEEYVAAVTHATHGLPFLVHELLEGASPDALAAADDVPAVVSRWVLRRLEGTGPAAGAVAEAVAILGERAEAARVARLAGLAPASARDAVDVLVERSLLVRGTPLRYRHPIVGRAVYSALRPARRSELHVSAARLLAAEGATADVIAAHLLASDPPLERSDVTLLREAAAGAMRVGAPAEAAAYLARAVSELDDVAARAELLHELGSAERLLRRAESVAHLQEAMRLSDDPQPRAQIAYELVLIFAWTGQWEQARTLIDATLSDPALAGSDVAVRMEAAWAATAAYDPRARPEFERRLPALRPRAHGSGGGACELTLLIAASDTVRADASPQLVALTSRTIRALLAAGGVESWAIGQAMEPPVVLDDLDAAGEIADKIGEAARAAGSIFGLLATGTLQMRVAAARGDLFTTSDELRRCLDIATEHGIEMGIPSFLRFGTPALLERPELERVAEIAWHLELPPALVATLNRAVVDEVCGRLALRDGDTDIAAQRLLRAGEVFAALDHRNPLATTWRSNLALAVADHDADEARRLVEDELDDARRLGLPRAIGVALTAQALLAPRHERPARLREAVQTLARSPARLEQAHALVELGSALRRTNRLGQAVEPLRAGLDLAERCGAARLADRAGDELRSAGARPRRRRIHGPLSLTASELRVARLAAAGLTNREIARRVYVTPKTVENQLRSVYQKLGVTGRDRLADALAAE